MAKVSKNARTDRKVQEGSKDNVKVIAAFRTNKNTIKFKDSIVHKDKLQEFVDNHFASEGI